MREEMSLAHYQSFMEAFESDIKCEAFAYLPVAGENIESMQKGGPVKWLAVGTPKGRMIGLFTSRDQVEKHKAGNHVGVKLSAFVRAALGDKGITGILVNPLDGHHGIPVERHNLELLAQRAGLVAPSIPKMNPGVVSNAVYHLWEIAVGVPTSVYDVSAELKALGGLDKTLGPVLQKWNTSVADGTYKPVDPMDYVRGVLRDVVATGFVYGAMALKHPDKALEVDIDRCIDGIPDLRGDIEQNVDQYLVLLSDATRSALKEQNEEYVKILLSGNLGIMAFGAFNFGLGWGMAKDAESRGVMELAELRDRQQKWIEDFKEKVASKMREDKENREHEDGK